MLIRYLKWKFVQIQLYDRHREYRARFKNNLNPLKSYTLFTENPLGFRWYYKDPFVLKKNNKKGKIMNDQIIPETVQTEQQHDLPEALKDAKEVKIVQTPADRGDNAKEVDAEQRQ